MVEFLVVVGKLALVSLCGGAVAFCCGALLYMLVWLIGGGDASDD